MYPQLQIGNITLYSYGLFLFLGIACALALTFRHGRPGELSDTDLINLAASVLVGILLGCRLLYLCTEFSAIQETPELLFRFDRGYVFYGGLLGGSAGAVLYLRHKKYSVLPYTDCFAPALACGQGFGRIGCFMAGCCFGRPTASAIQVTFHRALRAPNGVPLIPVQLFSAALDFCLAAWLLCREKKHRGDGSASADYLILYSLGRFCLEFLRGDDRGGIGILSTSQLISLFVFPLGVWLAVCSRKTATASK